MLMVGVTFHIFLASTKTLYPKLEYVWLLAKYIIEDDRELRLKSILGWMFICIQDFFRVEVTDA